MRQKQFLRPLIHQALCFLRWKHLRLLTLLTQQLIRLILLIEGRSLLYDQAVRRNMLRFERKHPPQGLLITF